MMGRNWLMLIPRRLIPVQHTTGKKQRRGRRMGKERAMWKVGLMVAALMAGHNEEEDHCWKPRLPRFDLSEYDGQDDSLSWLRHCERYFHVHKVQEEDWVEIARLHLAGEAQVLDNWQLEEPWIAWEDFYGAFIQRFTRHLGVGPLGDLVNLKQDN
ncbi:hypothetical protein GUJ93_ZPchr0005g15591 [Zizania palustris]|uniref:Uncharacterized protein n=1 Tax=Zizania palustris TaxID=103762 RepID=A0A8J5S4M8_ZIZPA|nr:hypothetical protein GUJ93_ZPchr0005g15591 [Zizania palustris]